MSTVRIISTEQAKHYVKNWRNNEATLNAESALYLSTMTDDENRRVIKRIYSHIHAPLERDSGLLEQQKWFAKLHK